MLRTRVLTALVIAALLIPAIFFLDSLSWALLTAVITGVAGWEFARLAGFCPTGQYRYGIVVGALLIAASLGFDATALNALGQISLVLSIAFWVGVVPFWLRARWAIKAHWKMALVGMVVLLPTWYALISIRAQGPAWLFAALLLVAGADISAYFFGRAFGKKKLAPNISPGKTWEGAYGAMATVTLATIATAVFLGLGGLVQWASMLILMPLLTMVSIAGDLFESLLKRQIGLKDSSQLLPGHGGVLDRIDSHTAALPMIALLLGIL